MSALVCPKCGSANVININMTMETEAPVAFYSCHSCEHRWWFKDGEPIDLGEVLTLAKRMPRRSARRS
ncbi:MAG TPA: hypothetical protein VGB52_02515 [Actinomycetota bacterium]